MSTTASPIRRMATSVEDGGREVEEGFVDRILLKLWSDRTLMSGGDVLSHGVPKWLNRSVRRGISRCWVSCSAVGFSLAGDRLPNDISEEVATALVVARNRAKAEMEKGTYTNAESA
jgi:hypothetical protein